MQQLSGWHSSAVGEETETPEVRDVTGAPQVGVCMMFMCGVYGGGVNMPGSRPVKIGWYRGASFAPANSSIQPH